MSTDRQSLEKHMTALELADKLQNVNRWTELRDDECDAAAAELRRLAELERDAARYRWLRGLAFRVLSRRDPRDGTVWSFDFLSPVMPDGKKDKSSFDAAIDAAMGAAK